MAEENGLNTRFGDWKVVGVLQKQKSKHLSVEDTGAAPGAAGPKRGFAGLPASWHKRPDITGFIEKAKELNILGEVKSTSHVKKLPKPGETIKRGRMGSNDLEDAGVFPVGLTSLPPCA